MNTIITYEDAINFRERNIIELLSNEKFEIPKGIAKTLTFNIHISDKRDICLINSKKILRVYTEDEKLHIVICGPTKCAYKQPVVRFKVRGDLVEERRYDRDNQDRRIPLKKRKMRD